MIYVSSQRPAYAVANCLDSRLSGTEQSQHNGVTDIAVGSNSYFVTLTPSGNGSVIKVVRGSGNEPAEEAMLRDRAARSDSNPPTPGACPARGCAPPAGARTPNIFIRPAVDERIAPTIPFQRPA